jgi:hypothetical protein
MRDIYWKAKSVIAWIGEEMEGTPAAIAFLEDMARREVQNSVDGEHFFETLPLRE